MRKIKMLELFTEQRLVEEINQLIDNHAVLLSAIQVLTEKITAAESTIHKLQKQVAYLEDNDG